MTRTRLIRLMIAPLTLTLLLAMLAVGCSAFGPSAQDISNRTAIAGIQASLSALNDQRTMTADSSNLHGTSTQAAGTARALLSTQNYEVTGTARSVSLATAGAIATATSDKALKEANAPAGWKLALYDPFEDNKNEWPVGKDDTNEFNHLDERIEGGHYLWTATARQGFVQWAYPTSPSGLSDFYVTVDGKLETGESSTAYGIVARLSGSDYYVFELSEQSVWTVAVHKQGVWNTLGSGHSGQIVAGGNHLAVSGIGTKFIFYVNNAEIARVTDERLDRGSVGLIIDMGFRGAESTVSFDNFTVLAP